MTSRIRNTLSGVSGAVHRWLWGDPNVAEGAELSEEEKWNQILSDIQASQLRLPEKKVKEYYLLFKEIDTDNSGSISRPGDCLYSFLHTTLESS